MYSVPPKLFEALASQGPLALPANSAHEIVESLQPPEHPGNPAIGAVFFQVIDSNPEMKLQQKVAHVARSRTSVVVKKLDATVRIDATTTMLKINSEKTVTMDLLRWCDAQVVGELMRGCDSWEVGRSGVAVSVAQDGSGVGALPQESPPPGQEPRALHASAPIGPGGIGRGGCRAGALSYGTRTARA